MAREERAALAVEAEGCSALSIYDELMRRYKAIERALDCGIATYCAVQPSSGALYSRTRAPRPLHA